MIRLVGAAVGIEQHFAPRFSLPETGFIDVGPHPHRAGQGEGQHRAARVQHAAGLDGAGQQRAVSRGYQGGVVQIQLRLRQLGLGLFEAGFGLGDILLAVAGAVLAQLILGRFQGCQRLVA